MTNTIKDKTRRIFALTYHGLLVLALLLFVGCESSGGGDSGDSSDNDFGGRDPSKCAVIGDSIARGYGDAGTPWPARLSGKLGRPVANYAIGGIETSQGFSPLGSALQSDAGYILISLGVNDAIAGNSADTVKSNLAAMIQRVRAASAVPVLGNVTQLSGVHAYANNSVVRINAAIDDLCNGEGVLLVNLNGAVSSDMLQADGLHPNSDGQEAIAKAFDNKLRNRVK